MEPDLLHEGPPKGGAMQTAKELFAGSIGGIVQVLVGQPFDTVKVRLQTQPKDAPLYNGMGDCIAKTYKNDGFAGFYKGTLTPLIGIGACVSIQFGALEYMKRIFVEKNKAASSPTPTQLSIPQLFVAGAVSGTANSFLAGPIEHVRTRLQIQTKSGAAGAAAGNAAAYYTGPGDFVRKVYGAHGIPGIFKGQVVTIVRECLGFGMYFTTYEWLIQRAMRLPNGQQLRRDEVPTWKQCLYGAAAGYALWLTVYPVDAVKSKLQTDSFDKSTAKYKSIIDCFRKTYRHEGLGGFYRGFWACMFRAAPVNAATFVAYEATMNLIGR
ncbi:Mitochondrial carrier protein ymc2 [Quaeritorhiza haematococci]|nr:Mitochondrial carrier protein ymc2 [Quaeritorhiza haematococci]